MRLKTGGLNVDQQILAQQPLVTQAFQHLQRLDAVQAFALNDLWRAIDQRMDAWALVRRNTQQVLQQRHYAWRAKGMDIEHRVLRGGQGRMQVQQAVKVFFPARLIAVIDRVKL